MRFADHYHPFDAVPTHYEPIGRNVSKTSAFFVSELWPTKFSGLLALPKGFPKISNFGAGDPPNFSEIWTKVQTINPHISSPKGIWGPILVWGDVRITGLLNFQNWGT